ncbi:hypothetical protein GCK32_011422 [Trichostrongylus colubriformis]|uniref:Uncharacterized protein n=1 Tax=Trichostrongylus colubriformis TaxID=6319 RepID=A0AAN8IKT6_TRICO
MDNIELPLCWWRPATFSDDVLSPELEEEKKKRSNELIKEESKAGEIKEKREDKKILESMARVGKDLRRVKHEIFALGHRIEELRREESKANKSKNYA